MQNIYLVYYDNGERWEDHHQYVSRVFSSLESAQKYVDEKNTAIQTYTPSITEEEYNPQEMGMSYEDFIQNEVCDWSMAREARYYVKEQEVHP